MVRRRKEQGADLIKIFASKSQRVGAGPTFTEEQLRVLCGEATALGLRTMVHAYRSQSGAAARAGCREIEHVPTRTQADIDDVGEGRRLHQSAGRPRRPELSREQGALSRRRRLHGGGHGDHGARPAAGFRDLHHGRPHAGREGRVLDRRHGRRAWSQRRRVHRPRAALRQTPMAALVSANSLAAEAIGMGERLGSLAPGYEADIIALDGDPLTDITAVRRVVFVMRGGVVYKWAGAKGPLG